MTFSTFLTKKWKCTSKYSSKLHVCSSTTSLFCCYDEDDSGIVTFCNFAGLGVEDLDPKYISYEGSTCTGCKLMRQTVKTYVALSGWKPILHSITSIR